ncbi:antitoxin [Streptomyces sp. HUAS TT3]|uniref:antitoxin n=1 Tax=Streptomyces sp. HUAS TT3 TaxID=3447510 RepID=UPI003F655485
MHGRITPETLVGEARTPQAEEAAMSVMDKLRQMLKGHESQAAQGVDKAGDHVDEKTQNKYTRHVDTAQEKLKGQLGNPEGGQDQPPRAY